MKSYDPKLKAEIQRLVDIQLTSGEPPHTQRTLERLVSEGWSQTDARSLIGQAVEIELDGFPGERKPFNRERFLRNLLNLPSQPAT